MFHQQQDSNIRRIKYVNFGIASSDELRKTASCKIISHHLEAVHGALYDPRMGYIPELSKTPCETCGLEKECQGHFGYIDLYEDILHPMFYKTIKSYLEMFCHNCFHLLLSEESLQIHSLLKYKGMKRFNKILKFIQDKNELCTFCDKQQPKIKIQDNVFFKEHKHANKGISKQIIPMTVKDIKNIFDNISDQELELLCIDPKYVHPRNFIMSVFPVIPTCCRPPVHNANNGTSGDDDLTCQMSEMIKCNNILDPDNAKASEIKAEKRAEVVRRLAWHIAAFYDNTKCKANYLNPEGRTLTSIKDRIDGKGSRVRGNLMGKRVDYSARTVIGSGPELEVNQVSIPKFVAETLTFPEPVNQYNIERLTKIVNNCQANSVIKKESFRKFVPKFASVIRGTELEIDDIVVRGDDELILDEKGNIIIPEQQPLQNVYLKKTDKNIIILRTGDRVIRDGKLIEVKLPQKREIKLDIGDIVERHLQDGDWVLFNRQPSLHRGSMLGMRVVVQTDNGKTFRFSPSTTKTFNADFDGKFCCQQETLKA